MLGIISGSVEALFLVVKTDGDERDWEFFGSQLARNLQHHSNARSIIAGGWHSGALPIIVSANENVSFSIPRFGHNVSAISSELL